MKPLSPKCEVEVSERAPFDRLKLSKEEIEIINNGAGEVRDWRKIKL